MNARILLAARWITSVLLVVASVAAIHADGISRIIGGVEMIAAVLFVVPRIWRIGGYALLAVIGTAMVIHASSGHPPILLAFPALVIVMTLVIRP